MHRPPRYDRQKPPPVGGLCVCVLIYCFAASPGSPLGPAGPGGPAGPAAPGGPAGPARPQFCISTSLLSSPEAISTTQVEGNSVPIHLNPPVGLPSTCTVSLGLILICTLGSRARLTLPIIVNSPRDMAAVVMSISARAFPTHMITPTAAITEAARIRLASTANLPGILSIQSLKLNENKSRDGAERAHALPDARMKRSSSLNLSLEPNGNEGLLICHYVTIEV